MIDPEHDLPIKQQAEVLGISRSTVYYEPRPISDEDLWLMRRLDELHLNYPFAGSRMLRGLLWQQGLEVGRRHIKTLMKRMGIEAIYRKPNTSKPALGHKIYPYLLRDLAVTLTQPSLGDGHHLHSHGARIHLSGRSGGLVQPQGSFLAIVDHDGSFLLYRSGGRGSFQE
jgi:putative transposase